MVAQASYSELLNEAKANGRLRHLTPQFHEWKNKGDKLVGKLRGKVKIESKVGDYNQYLLETDNGMVKFHLGGAADKEVGSLLRRGKIYLFEYLGQEKIDGGRTINKFNIMQIVPEDEEEEEEEEEGEEGE